MERTAATEPLLATDIILMLVAASGGTPAGKLNGITRLEKLAFLVAQETSVNDQAEDPFEFEAYNYGPYSKEVYEAVDLLKDLGLISESREYDDSGLDEMEESTVVASDNDGVDREGTERRFSLTENGEQVSQLLVQHYSEQAAAIASIRARYGRMSLRHLIRYVYDRYPRYAEKSLIRDDIMGT
jgi:uncharacterized protein